MISQSQSQRTFVKRLLPGSDLKRSIAEICQSESLQAGVVLTAVGSLTQVHLRLAGAREFLKREGVFEIQSLTGTMGCEGLHLHLMVSDRQGMVIGGHLMDENIIHTTSEVIITDLLDLRFSREIDLNSGFKELVISQR